MLYCSDVKLRQRLISLGCGQLSVGREAARAWCNRPCCSTTTLRAVGIVSQPAGVAPVCFGRRRHVGAHRRSVCARHDAPPILHRLGQRVVGALHHGQPVVHVVAPARLVRHLQNNSRSSPLVKYTQRLASGVQTRDRLSLPPSRRFQQGLNILQCNRDFNRVLAIRWGFHLLAHRGRPPAQQQRRRCVPPGHAACHHTAPEQVRTRWVSVAGSSGGGQQTVATAEAVREWARPPCRHFKNLSCFASALLSRWRLSNQPSRRKLTYRSGPPRPGLRRAGWGRRWRVTPGTPARYPRVARTRPPRSRPWPPPRARASRRLGKCTSPPPSASRAAATAATCGSPASATEPVSGAASR
jgi:hypothetical protein